MKYDTGRFQRRTVLKAIGAVGAIGGVSGVASATGGNGRSPRLELIGHSTLGARDGANTHAAVNEDLGLAAVGSFVSVDPEVRIVDISDPTDPELTGWVETGPGGDIRNSDIHPTEPYVFTANEGGADAGWAIVDASDKENPELVTHVNVEDAGAGVHNVQTFGEDYLIAALHHGDRGIVVYDISDPADPEEVSEFQVDDHMVHAAHVRDEYVFLSHWNAGLWILDLSEPADPEVVGLFDYREEEADVPLRNCHHAVPHPSEDIVLLGEEVGSDEPGYKHIVEFDLDTGETELLSSFQFPQHANQTGSTTYWWTGHFSDWGVGDQEDVVFSGDYKAGVQAFDVSDPADPVRIDQYMPAEGVGEIRRQDPVRSDLLDHVPFTWGAESSLAGDSGRVYAADATTGLYILELEGY
jgi:hypothetical protein